MLIEWLIERRRKPGPVGSIEVEGPERGRGGWGWLAFRGLVGAALIGAGAIVALRSDRPLAGLGALACYLLVSWFVNPRPDRSNLGLLGGLIDHPFRWSDDRNRILLFLQVLLLPGRLAGGGMRDLVTLIRNRPAAPRFREKGVIWERRD